MDFRNVFEDFKIAFADVLVISRNSSPCEDYLAELTRI